MKYRPRAWPWRAVGRVAAGALVFATCASAALAQAGASAADSASKFTMKMALQTAWERSVDAAESQGRQSRARAELAVAQSWLAGSAAMTLSQREGRAGTPVGTRETEVGLALPIWRFGQRAAGGHAAEAEAHWAQLAEQAARLRLAGRLREVVGSARMAEAEVRQGEQQVESFHQMADDVGRRVGAGDLAPADAMAAKAEYLAAQAQLRTARQAWLAELANWRLLTGLEQLPVEEEQDGALPVGLEQHPDQLLADAAVELGQRRVALVQVQRTDTPELSVGMRQERAGQSGGTQNSVVIGLRLPFGGDVHQQPRVAAALSELELARVQALRTRDRLLADHERARANYQASQAQVRAEQERASLLRERTKLIDKSFRAGETPLPELLRAIGAAAIAETASARQQAAHQLAAGRLQQALGLLP